ncbi:hypothetical protein ABEG18_12515 [Alsobacter sp. KACC 23698]|uniref:Tetratricopeptide repeat protein n=1 Tax=Alsobacter sp. KACC 23698 TaxID=3149229 RepID=A0AAU7JM97_9HYPH
MDDAVQPSPIPPQERPPGRLDVERLVALADREQAQARYPMAIALYRLALEADPYHLGAASRLARALFCAERWSEAWPAYEVRFRLMPEPPCVTRRGEGGRREPVRRWTGGPAPRRLLVMAEQGLGDTLQFCRFLPRLAQAGVKASLVAPGALLPLLASLDAPVELRPLEAAGSVAGIDAWATLLDLPRAMGLAPADYGAPAPYLRADPARVAAWRDRLAAERAQGVTLLVGIAWRGNRSAPGDARRSAALEDFAPIAAIPGARLVCLQKDAEPGEIAGCSFASSIFHPGPDFDAGEGAFSDTAAIMASLDRIVCVDTAVAHLAGALGRPADLLLQPDWADWRWLGRALDTIWYPTLRLRRRARGETFADAVAQAAVDLAGGAGPGAGQGSVAGVALTAPLSAGELLDRISILDLKAERILDAAKRAHVRAERSQLRAVRDAAGLPGRALEPLAEELRRVNGELWDVEDRLRACEAGGDFGPRFVALARSVYHVNDRRAALKREISRRAGSPILEEKSYG